MVVIQSVMDASPLLPMPHQATRPQEFQLLADRRLLHSQPLGDRVHRQFSGLEEKENLQAGGVPEDLEEVGDIGDLLVEGKQGSVIGRVSRVHDSTVPQPALAGNRMNFGFLVSIDSVDCEKPKS